MKINPSYLKQMIAEAAYYRAEQRNFEPGDAVQDWLEAEQAITASLKAAQRRMAPPTPSEAPATARQRKRSATTPGTTRGTAKRAAAAPATDSSAP